MKIFALPDIGEGLQEAEIVAWHISPGDHVVADQPIVSIETDKAVVELPSPWSGTVEQLRAKVGEVVAVGAPLVAFKDVPGEDRGAIVGELAEADADSRDAGVPVAASSRPGSGAARGLAMPAVRAYATNLGVDLSKIRGSGPDGVILKSDVDNAAAAAAASNEGFEPITGPRRTLAKNMARSARSVVPTTVTDLADITSWWHVGADITARAISALAFAAECEPSLNAWFDGEKMMRKLHSSSDVGLAVDTADGLFVPVVRDAGSLDLNQLRQVINELTDRVRQRTVSLDDMRGPTISLSNFGSIAGRHASLVLLPPQVAIVGLGRVEAVLRIRDGEVIECSVLPVSLTFDHRAATGGEATRFLAAFNQRMQAPQ